MIVKIVVPDSIYANVYFARGEQGPQGPTGLTGSQGPSGVVNVDSPITNSGTSTAANIGINQALLSITPSQVIGTAVITTDARLSDTRIPTDASVTDSKIVGTGLSPNKITGTAVITTDSRLSDARTPLAHAASHGSAGSDPVTLAQSQITNLVSDLSAKAPSASPTFTGTVTTPVTSGTLLWTDSSGVLGKVGNAPGLGYVPYTASVTGGIAWQNLATLVKTDAANTFTVGGQVINNAAVGTIPLLLKGVASQTANMLEIRDENNSTFGSISKFGTTSLGGSVMSGARLMVQAGGSLVGLQVRDGGNNADYLQLINSSGSITAKITSSAQPRLNLGTTDLSATFGVNGHASGGVVAVIRGASGQTANLQEWQNSAGTILGRMDINGYMRALRLNTFNDYVVISESNSGGSIRLLKATATATPLANEIRLQVLAGTNANTLKLVAVGPGGTATTIVDNIP